MVADPALRFRMQKSQPYHKTSSRVKPYIKLPSARTLFAEVDGFRPRKRSETRSPSLDEGSSFEYSDCSTETETETETKAERHKPCLTKQHYIHYHEYYPETKANASDIIEVWLADELKGKSLAWWQTEHRDRSAERIPYSDGITTAKRKRSSAVVDAGSSQQRRSCQTNVDHKEKEQDRRRRHAFLQRASDIQCSEFHFTLANKHMADLKSCLGQARKQNENHKQETSKDQQLLATLFQQIMARWIEDAQFQVHLLNTPQI